MLMTATQLRQDRTVGAVRDAITRSLEATGDPVAECLPVRRGLDTKAGSGASTRLPPVGGPHAVGRAARHHTLALKKWDDRDRRERAVKDLVTFVRSFRVHEVRLVLALLAADDPTRPDIDYRSATEPESVDAVASAVTAANRAASGPRRYDDRLCRLLATGDIVRAAERWNVVEDAVDVGTGLPSGIDGMVIPTVEGPVVDRIGDLSVQINRPVDGRIRISLIQRFVLNGTDTVVRLVRRRTPPGGCSCAG